MPQKFDGLEIADDATFLEFRSDDTFGALYALQAWCEGRGVSCGITCAGKPVGLMWGDFRIAKWKNLTTREIANLHGLVRGDFRNGPLVLRLNPDPRNAKSSEAA